ncbi:MAG: hypothetical protein NC395_03585 [Prevotella sp.]|nr:hypothetical protein [Prevotella sp.]
MNKNTLDSYLPKPKSKTEPTASKHTTNPIIEYTAHGKFAKLYPPKLICATNKIREICRSLNSSNYQRFPQIYMIVQYAENIDNSNIGLPFTAIDQKLYFSDCTGTHEYDKNSIFKGVPDAEKDKLISLFDAMYNFCTEIQKLYPLNNYIQCYNFFLVNYDSNSISDYNTLFKYLVNPYKINSDQCFLSNGGYLIFRLNKKPVIALNNDILDYN